MLRQAVCAAGASVKTNFNFPEIIPFPLNSPAKQKAEYPKYIFTPFLKIIPGSASLAPMESLCKTIPPSACAGRLQGEGMTVIAL